MKELINLDTLEFSRIRNQFKELKLLKQHFQLEDLKIMKQEIRLSENYSKKLHDDVTSDLKGYVTVQVKNKKTGEIEHQENHNLIVYSGREWLLRRIFGKTLAGAESNIDDQCIRWVGFGTGGGEAGNPLQAGTTLGHDTDLYQPCRLRFNDDTILAESSKYYASRLMPNGSIVSGYYKKIQSVTIKEDHANPYVEGGLRKYPKLIAEIRCELSGDDANGENYTQSGNLVAYQDINEVGLFISDSSVDPGLAQNYNEILVDATKGGTVNASSTTKVSSQYLPSNITANFTRSNSTWTSSAITQNSYVLQYRSYNDGSYGDWTTITGSGRDIPRSFNNNDVLSMTLETTQAGSDTKALRFKVNGTSTDIAGWTFSWDGDLVDEHNVDILQFRLLSVGKFIITWKNAMTPDSAEDVSRVLSEVQYRNTNTEEWRILNSYTFSSIQDTTTIRSVTVVCGDTNNPDIGQNTQFRVRYTTDLYNEFNVSTISGDDTSYDLKFFVSNTADIDKVKRNQMMFINSGNVNGTTISKSAPVVVTEVYDPRKGLAAKGEDAYFVVQSQPISDAIEQLNPTTGMYERAWNGTLGVTSYDVAQKSPYTLFSRVTLSSVRKTTEREIIIIWKIYV